MNRSFYSFLTVCLALALLAACPGSASAAGTVTLSPSTYNFGTVTAGTGTNWVPFKLTNTNTSAVTISSAAVSGPFVVSSQCGSTVAASGSCIIYVYFAPTSSSPATGTLTLTDSAGTQTSALSGNGGTTTPTVATPVISPGTESFTTSSVSVTITDSTSGATIYYTTTGATPTTGSTKYSGAITVSATESIKAIAVATGDTNSAVASATYTKITPCTTVPGAFTLTAAMPAGVVSGPVVLSWTTPSEGAGCTLSGYTVHIGSYAFSVAAGTNTYTPTNLAAGTYTAYVSATNGDGSTNSNSVTVVLSAPTCATAPGAFTLSASSITSSGVTLSWTVPSEGAGCTLSGYAVHVGSNTYSVAAGSTTYSATGLTAATAYSFYIAATNGDGATDSNTLSVTTLPTQSSSGNGHTLIGYWHDFDNGSVDITLAASNANFDVIEVAFGGTTTDTSTISFDVYSVETQEQFIKDVATLHAAGKKVILSIGGENGNVALYNASEISNFVTSVSALMTLYNFDGIDIDIENNSLAMTGDTDYTVPKTTTTINLITALHQLAAKFPGFVLTFAPQLDDVQGGVAAYSGPWGDYLPLLYGCRDILSLVMVQDYNTGGVPALDGKTYSAGTADFHVAMTEMLLAGFKLANGQTFPAFQPGQVVFGVLASASAGSSGYTAPSAVLEAIEYLRDGKSYGGQYVLQHPAGYPGVRGVMTWSINWDQVNGYALSKSVAPYLHSLTPAIPAP